MTMPSNRPLLLAVCLFATTLLVAGCGDGDDDSQNDAGQDTGVSDTAGACEKSPPTMPAAHACWHVCSETPIEVTATGAASNTPPATTFGKTYAITLQDDGNGTFAGAVRFDAAEDGRAAIADGDTKAIHFHTVRDVPISVTVAGGSDTVSMADSSTFECAQGLKYSKSFELEAAEYDVTFGPTDTKTVTLVTVPLGGPAQSE